MFHRDYLQRMIERFGEMMRRLVSLRMEEMPDRALSLIGDIYEAYFPFSPDMIRHTPAEETAAFMEDYEELSEDHWTILAEILKEEGELWYSRGEWVRGDESLHKAIVLLEELNRSNPELYSFERNQKINSWRKKRDESEDNVK